MRWVNTAIALLVVVSLSIMLELKFSSRMAPVTVVAASNDQAPRQRQEFRHRTDKSENARTYTFVDGQVRKVEIRFADGVLGYRFLDGTTVDGKPRLTACEEIHDNKTRYTFEFGEDGRLRSTTAYDKKGLVAYRESYSGSNLLRTFHAEDGVTVVATLELYKEGGYKFVAFDGSERKLYQEQFSEYQSPAEMEEGGSTRMTTCTVWNGSPTPQYRQVWLQDDRSGSKDGKLDKLEYFRDGSTQVAQRVTFGQDGTISVRYLDNDENVVSIRTVSGTGRLMQISDTTKTPVQAFTMPPDTQFGEAVGRIHLRKPGTEAMNRLLANSLAGGSGYLHLDRLQVE